MQNIRVKAVRVSHHDRHVDAVLYMPEQRGVYPIVIFSHGYNGHKSDFDESARFLAERGTAAICYTFCGGSSRDESGMATTDMTLFTEKEDLQAVIMYAKSLEEVDVDNIFAFGASQGGLVTALTVDNMDEDIKGMILLFPAFCIADDWNKRFPRMEDIPEEQELWGMTMGRHFFETIHGMDVFEHVGKYKNDILVIHGDIDPVVELGYSRRLETIYENVRLEVFVGEGHGFTAEGNQKMTQMLYKFVTDCMK